MDQHEYLCMTHERRERHNANQQFIDNNRKMKNEKKIEDALTISREYLPEGYVIVPIEPTEAMMQAAFRTTASEWSDPIGHFASHYKAMIEEAQK